jgi:hypothetical protein
MTQLDNLRAALEAARNGLQWYRDKHPEDDSGADDEMMAQIDEALSTPHHERGAEGAGEPTKVVWRNMATAPKDGTLVRLLVEFEHHATEDGEGPQPTIGANTYDNHHDFDEWQFAGWNWEHDCYTQGVGTPIGWLPMLADAPCGATAEDAGEPTAPSSLPLQPRTADASALDELPHPVASVIDVQQVIYALERARDQLQSLADKLHDQQDYSAEFPAEDADRMREAIALLRARPTRPEIGLLGARS